MFADRAKIIIRSGRGGDGHVSFRREKFVPDGGPDGGDGGRGGDVIFETDGSLNTLVAFRHHRKFSATDGEAGKKKRQHGRDGKDLTLKVPPGTVIKLAQTGEVIADMSGENERKVILKGGRGGLGNMHFATSSMQAPTYAQPGQEARELEVLLELKLIADVGLIGYPNVGKSTLLSRISNAAPKIANYHFTTLEPNLGVVDLGDDGGFIVADIPGLIEGASRGAGLGHEFLRHIERCRLLVQVVDAASTEGRDPVEDIIKINDELSAYDSSLTRKPQIIAANKCDAIAVPDGYPHDTQDIQDPVERIRSFAAESGTEVYPISGVTGQGIKELLYGINDKLKTIPKSTVIFEQEYFPEEHGPGDDLPFDVWRDEKDPHLFHVEGPKIEKMLGYTNLDSEKGFRFFQNFLKDNGILKQLEDLGIQENDTVRLYGLQFEYFK